MTDRQPPANVEAEQGLLGAIMIQNSAFDRVADIVRPDHFAYPVHGMIFETCAQLIAKGGKADPISLRPLVEQFPGLSAEMMADGGVPAYLARLAASCPSTYAARDYAKAINAAWMRRSIIGLCQLAIDEAHAYDPNVSEADMLAALSKDLDGILEGQTTSRLLQIGGAADAVAERAQEAARNKNHMTGLATGFVDLDRMTGGLNAGELIVLAARPGMGKTALAVAIALYVAARGTPVGFFSLEMPAAQIARRCMSALSGLPLHKIKRGDLDGEDFDRLNRARATLKQIPLYIDDGAALNPAAIRARARALRRRYGPGLTIVDHIQIMRGGERYQNRTAEVTDISGGLKAAAKELDGPVIALSQLSRGVEGRDDKRPTLQDLRESGSIEQDADMVAFLYREEYYHRQKEPDLSIPSNKSKHLDWEADLERLIGKAELIVAKQRDGETGRCQLHFDGERVTFGNLGTRRDGE